MNEEGREWRRVIGVDEVQEGEVVGVTLGERPIAVYRVEGEFYATADRCTHAAANLSDGELFGCLIECPLHNGRFDIRTGKAMTSPVTRDLVTYPVRVQGDDIEVLVRV